MRIHIRFVLQLILLFGSVSFIYLEESHSNEMIQSEQRSSKLAILQGATSFHSTQIAVLVSSFMTYEYQLTDSTGHTYMGEVLRKSRTTSDYAIEQISYSNLPSNTEFEFDVYRSSGEHLDRRSLKTFDESKKNIRIALASCMSDAFIFPQAKIWGHLQQEHPDAVFFLGDNVYASLKDAIDPAKMWERYVQTRSLLSFFRAERLLPVFATWDDHDFGQNNGDKSYAYVREAQEIFQDFFPQAPIPQVLEKGPGISQVLTLFGRQFLFLDDRSFRDHPHGETMWGEAQEQWLHTHLQNSLQPSWIINGSQFFGKFGPSESLEQDFPNHFSRFTNMLQTVSQDVSFVSGDIHATEVLRVPANMSHHKSFEITSSSMHSFRSPFEKTLKENPRRVAGYDGDSFVILTFDVTRNEDSMIIEGYNDSHRVFELNRGSVL